jgi:hypothetical protein
VQQQPADTGAVELLDVLPAGAVALEVWVPESRSYQLSCAFARAVTWSR